MASSSPRSADILDREGKAEVGMQNEEVPANVQLEPSVKLTEKALDELGENFEKASKGFIDFLLLNEKSFPFIVLEAKGEDKSPLIGKEQARKYYKSQNCRFVILSNGNLHYFWDLERGNPYVITAFPTPTSATGYQKTTPVPKRLIEEVVGDDYVVLTQRPNYATETAWKNESERARFIEVNGLRCLRLYQKTAIYAIQQAIKKGSDRFLLEMATGTGKTLTAASLIKLFLVDRLELEDQALKAFKKVLANDYKSVIYKENSITSSATSSASPPRRSTTSRKSTRTSRRPKTRASSSAASCSIPIAPLAAMTVSPRSATRCSMA